MYMVVQASRLLTYPGHLIAALEIFEEPMNGMLGILEMISVL